MSSYSSGLTLEYADSFIREAVTIALEMLVEGTEYKEMSGSTPFHVAVVDEKPRNVLKEITDEVKVDLGKKRIFIVAK